MGSFVRNFLRAGHGPSRCRVGGETDVSWLLHPKDTAKILVKFLGSLALTAASEEAFGARGGLGAEHKLILVSSTEGAGFSMKFSAHRSDFSDLFMHSASAEKGE